MTTRDERYGVPAFDAQVSCAVDALRDNSEEVLRSMYCAVIAFSRESNPEILVQFARDAAVTARLYAVPDHDHRKALDTTPTRPEGKGRDVREIFADLRG